MYNLKKVKYSENTFEFIHSEQLIIFLDKHKYESYVYDCFFRVKCSKWNYIKFLSQKILNLFNKFSKAKQPVTFCICNLSPLHTLLLPHMSHLHSKVVQILFFRNFFLSYFYLEKVAATLQEISRMSPLQAQEE